MTPDQHTQFSSSCVAFGEALEKIFTVGVPTMDRQILFGQTMHANDPGIDNPKKWEILEYKEKKRFRIIDAALLSKGCVPQYDIWKVRRLSDNTVWTVGDKVCFTHEITKGWDRNPEHFIKYFHIGDRQLMYSCCDSHVPVCGPVANTSGSYKSGSFLLCQLNKCEQNRITLFTTADGVELFEGDKAYTLLNGTIFEWDAESANRPSFPHISYSTPEAAKKAYEDWLYAQPVICMDDIKARCHLSALELAELETLIQDKIANR